MLNPIQLRTLRTVVTAGSFAAAASELGYTASAVSQQMAGLERATGLVLFERQPRGVLATSAAHTLATSAQNALGELAAVERHAREMLGAHRGRVVIGGFPTASARIVPQAVAGMIANEPAVEVLLDEGESWNLVPRVVDGSIDVAVTYRYDLVPWQLPSTLAAVSLMAEPVLALRPPDHRARGTAEVSLSELRDEPWATTRVGTPGALFIDRITALSGFQPRVSYRSNDYSVIRGLVAAGLGVAVVPALAVGAEGASITVSPVAGITAERRVLAVYRPSAYQPLRDLVIDCLVEAASALTTQRAGWPASSVPGPGPRL